MSAKRFYEIMIKSVLKIGCLLFFVIAFISQALAQDSNSIEKTELKQFQDKNNSNARFNFFFSTQDKYIDNSAYDWLETVNVYIKNSSITNDSAAIRQYKLVKSEIYHDIGDYDKSIELANALFAGKEKLNDRTVEVLLNVLDKDYAKLKLYDKQVEVRKIKRELGFIEKVVFYDIYSNLGLHSKAMSDYIGEVKKDIKENDYYGLAVYNNTIGNYLRMDKSAETAISSYKKAKSFIDLYLIDTDKEKTEKDIVVGKLLRGIIDGNIGKCHVQLKEYDLAIPYLERSNEIIKQKNTGKYLEELTENRLGLAESHLNLRNYKTARKYLNTDFNIEKTNHVIKTNRLWALYYEKAHDFEKAISYLKRNVRISDSLNYSDALIKTQQLAAVAGQDMDLSRKLIDEQKIEMEKDRKEMQAMDEQINLVFISLVFTLLGFAGLVYAYLKSIKNQRLIAEQKYIIENSLVEKDSLLKEIHHRVKNNLQMVSSLLSLQARNTRSKAAIAALEEGKSRVKAMALIHQKLYQNDDLSVIEMQGYIESLINSVQSVYKKGGHNISINIDTNGVELDIDRAIPFGLILNELVSNSFKYAFPDDDENGKINIHLRKKNGEEGYFEYTDNGVGLPTDDDELTNSSMGIRLMNRLVNQLQSTLNIDKSVEGVRFWFNFK